MPSIKQCDYLFVAKKVSYPSAEENCLSHGMELATNLDQTQFKNGCRVKNDTNLYWVGLEQNDKCAMSSNSSRIVQWTKNRTCVDVASLPIKSQVSRQFNNCRLAIDLKDTGEFILRSKEETGCIKSAGYLCQGKSSPIKPMPISFNLSAVSAPTRGSFVKPRNPGVNNIEQLYTTSAGFSKPIKDINLSWAELGGIFGGIVLLLIMVVILMIALIKGNCSKCKLCKRKRTLDRKKTVISLQTLQRHINLHLKKSQTESPKRTDSRRSEKSEIYIKNPETSAYVNYLVEDVASSSEKNETTYQNLESTPELYFELERTEEEENPIPLYASSSTLNRIYVNSPAKEKFYENSNVETDSTYKIEPI